jgi:RNA polymerase sigma-70 factor (ECF subfamily)
MSQAPQIDALLVQRIRKGQPDAWEELIDRFEGRLLAFVESRLRDRASGEDVVQETFIGFLTSLPNFDPSRPLEGYLFSIAAHKLTDFLRREGRRPAIPLSSADGASGNWEMPGKARPASSILRSGERRGLEEQALAEAIDDQVKRWRERGDWTKLSCLELLFVRGAANKDVAARLGLTEQQVANFKFDFLAKLRSSIRNQKLSPEVFPELHE